MSLRLMLAGALCLPGTALAQGIALDAPFQVRYAANLQFGDSHINILNTGANGAPRLGPGLGTPGVGNICVNVYVVTTDEQLEACCSCLITPSQVVHLLVNGDLLPNTLTVGNVAPLTGSSLPVAAPADDEPSAADADSPDALLDPLAIAIAGVAPALKQRNANIQSVTIKLAGALPGRNGVPLNCTNSAALLPTAVLAGGYVATGTTPHLTPVANLYATTETPFLPVQLVTNGAAGASDELHSLGGRCAAILGNGGGFGVCKPCTQGALGANKN